MALDVRLLSYKLERAVEMHLLPLREHPRFKLAQVRYRINDEKWRNPPAIDEDNAVLVVDLQRRTSVIVYLNKMHLPSFL